MNHEHKEPYTKDQLLTIEMNLFEMCYEAIEADRQFTSKEMLYYEAYENIQKLRIWKEEYDG